MGGVIKQVGEKAILLRFWSNMGPGLSRQYIRKTGWDAFTEAVD